MKISEKEYNKRRNNTKKFCDYVVENFVQNSTIISYTYMMNASVFIIYIIYNNSYIICIISFNLYYSDSKFM